MQFINMTPHDVQVGGLTIQPCGMVARVKENDVLIWYANGPCLKCGDEGATNGLPVYSLCQHQFGRIPIYKLETGGVEGLPITLQDDTYYIVSKVVAQVAQNPSVVCPTGFIRDGSGKILGASGLAYYKGGTC